LASALHAGVIGINSGFPMSPGLPFGGKGESGYGREGGKAGLDEFLQQKSVYIPLAGGFM
jgi:aldehyde dehydrogenase (NAD+)